MTAPDEPSRASAPPDRFAWIRKLARTDAQRAFILSEIFGPPVALRPASRRAHVAGAPRDEQRELWKKLGIDELLR